MRLIDADELKKEFPHDEDWNFPVNTNGYVVETINTMPTVDAIPIEWIERKLKSKNITANVKLILRCLIEKWNTENSLYKEEK